MIKDLFAYILISLSASEAINAKDENGFKTQTKIIFNKKEEIETITLCRYKAQQNMLFYVSKSCENNLCKILKTKPHFISLAGYQNKIGSPGFKLCKELGGIPQIFEFKNSKGIFESVRSV